MVGKCPVRGRERVRGILGRRLQVRSGSRDGFGTVSGGTVTTGGL